MTYDEAVSKINSLLRFGMKPGLERIEKLLRLLGSPQDSLKFVHVAGTNGKGSTCALLSSVLTRAGLRTGLYTSPYITEFRERFQIDGEMIGRDELAGIVEEILPVAEQISAEDAAITEFEFITAAAMLWFARKKCDVVVLEVGLGGRLDATNVISTPLVSVIASISLDHTAILGDTVEQIAFEKCGIIKRGGVTVTSPEQIPGALAVIRQTAEERGNRFIEASVDEVTPGELTLHGTPLDWHGVSLRLPFLGKHQIRNAVTALAVVSVLREEGLDIPDKAVAAGFDSARIPARLEVFSENPPFLLDGAHNPGGTAALADALKTYLKGWKITALMGMLADKDTRTALSNLSGLFDHVVTLAPSNPRAMDAEALAALWRELGTPATPAHSPEEALSLLRERSAGGAAVICGSLYLAGDVRPYLR